jgi:hypothetical protein
VPCHCERGVETITDHGCGVALSVRARGGNDHRPRLWCCHAHRGGPVVAALWRQWCCRAVGCHQLDLKRFAARAVEQRRVCQSQRYNAFLFHHPHVHNLTVCVCCVRTSAIAGSRDSALPFSNCVGARSSSRCCCCWRVEHGVDSNKGCFGGFVHSAAWVKADAITPSSARKRGRCPTASTRHPAAVATRQGQPL